MPRQLTVIPIIATGAIAIFGWYWLCRYVPNWPLCWCGPPTVVVNCSDCDDDCPDCVTEPKATITVEQAHHGIAWMPFDNGHVTKWKGYPIEAGKIPLCSDGSNAFAPDCTYTDELRTGIQFQFGQAETWVVKRVIIRHSNGPEEQLDDDKFDWINVYTAGSDCVIDPLHAYALFRHPDFPGEPYKLVKTQCDGAGDSVVADGLPWSCARERQLHAGVKVETGIMTLWPSGGYHLEVEYDEQTAHLERFVFKLCEEVIADIFWHGCFIKRLSGVKAIVAESVNTGIHHGGIHDSPQDGGNTTPGTGG